jgi:hypothetical protein
MIQYSERSVITLISRGVLDTRFRGYDSDGKASEMHNSLVVPAPIRDA